MRNPRPVEAWVVYQAAVSKKGESVHVVCEQREWDAMQLLDPGQHQLVMAGIRTEAEADRQARDATVSLLTGPKRYR